MANLPPIPHRSFLSEEVRDLRADTTAPPIKSRVTIDWFKWLQTVVNKIDAAENAGVALPGGLTFIGYTSAAGNPTTTELPSSMDLAIHKNTGTSAVYLAFNDGGVIKKVQLT